MRDAFFSALTAAAERDERVWALTGDLGIGLFDEFCRVAPGRYLNVGIAEQALVGVAAGLAYAGQRPVAYSIAPFLTARAHEQVRVDVAIAGCALAHRIFLAAYVSTGRLVAALEREFADDNSYFLVMPERPQRPRREVRAFREWLMSVATAV